MFQCGGGESQIFAIYLNCLLPQFFISRSNDLSYKTFSSLCLCLHIHIPSILPIINSAKNTISHCSMVFLSFTYLYTVNRIFFLMDIKRFPWSTGLDSLIPMQAAQVQSLVRELRSYILHLMAKKKKKKIWNRITQLKKINTKKFEMDLSLKYCF